MLRLSKFTGYQEAGAGRTRGNPIETQNAILFESEKPEIVVLALGRNAELRKQLAEATNPVAIGRLLERIESKARIMPKAKPRQPQPRRLKGSNGAVINNLDKLKAKALETGDWTPYFAAKKAKITYRALSMANQLAKDLEIMFENYVEGFEGRLRSFP